MVMVWTPTEWSFEATFASVSSAARHAGLAVPPTKGAVPLFLPWGQTLAHFGPVTSFACCKEPQLAEGEAACFEDKGQVTDSAFPDMGRQGNGAKKRHP
jgi:predicted membrane-bound spermidine synthase